jgi:hypothetical protein
MVKPIFLPPKGFRPSDLARSAEWCDSPFNGQPRRMNNAAAAEGLRYERKVHGALRSQFCAERGAVLYCPSRWIRFRTTDPREDGPRYAQPDGFIIDFDRGLITIIEVKLKHVQTAWWGLRRLYEPLFRLLFGPSWAFAVCEVVAWYDPAVHWPEPFKLHRDPSALRPGEFGVHVLSWRELRYAELSRVAALPDFLGQSYG